LQGRVKKLYQIIVPNHGGLAYSHIPEEAFSHYSKLCVYVASIPSKIWAVPSDFLLAFCGIILCMLVGRNQIIWEKTAINLSMFHLQKKGNCGDWETGHYVTIGPLDLSGQRDWTTLSNFVIGKVLHLFSGPTLFASSIAGKTTSLTFKLVFLMILWGPHLRPQSEKRSWEKCGKFSAIYHQTPAGFCP